MLPCDLTKAAIWERDEDRRFRVEVEKHILADPIDLINSRFISKGTANLESKRTQLSPWRALTMVFMAVLTIPYLPILTVVPSRATCEGRSGKVA